MGGVTQPPKTPWGLSWRSSKAFIVASIALHNEDINSFLFSFIVPIMPDILEDRLHVAPSRIQMFTSIILSMNALLTIVIAPYTGHLSDQVARKNTLMLWSYAVNVVGTVVTALSGTMATLVIGRLIQTIGGSLLYIAGMAMLGATVGPEHLSKAMGICVLLISGGFLSAPALSAALYKFSNYAVTWVSAFVVLAIGTTLQALVIEPYLVTPDTRKEERNGEDNYTTPHMVEERESESDIETYARTYYDEMGARECDRLLSPARTPRGRGRFQRHHNAAGESEYQTFKAPKKNTPAAPSTSTIYKRMLVKKRVVTALVAETLLAALIASFETTIPLHIRDAFGWDSLRAGILFLVLQAPTMVLVFPIGWLKDRIGMRGPVTLGFVMLAPALWLLGVPGAKGFDWAGGKNGEALYISMLVAIGVARTLVLGFGGVEVLRGANEVASETPGLESGGISLYSRAFVLSNITWKLGMFLGPLVSGALTKSLGYYVMNFVFGELHLLRILVSSVVLRDSVNPMAQGRQVVALAGGTGDLGRYIHEELVKDDRFAVALLTRKAADANLTSLPHTTIHPTDYTESSLVSILNTTGATALISLIRCDNSKFVPLHKTLITACQNSSTCHRFIPSEWAGDIEGFPDIPISYGSTRAPVREYLRSLETKPGQAKLQWTLVNLGWFMDYFVAPGKSHMKYIEGEFPIDVESWTYTVRGTGEEPQSWTAGRDVARAVCALLASEQDWLTRYTDRPFKRGTRSIDAINADLRAYESQTEIEDVGLVEVEQWQVTGATVCPKEKTLRQREKYFSNVKFMSVEEMLKVAEKEGHV
ncbi:major facilitator superfamily domain-containing protein [Aspergillus multicolor]|uniref:major facilitator superfamily domain-containing protein n=1 Tax=Aspergillus multicolor TaxID=41759 RepID=UPI003CCD6415